MYNFLFISENYFSGYIDKSLIVIDIICIISAILVIVSKNPIISVLFLIGLFLSVASHLLISGLSFIGLSYLLVYVGAVSILFLFILMLINIRVSELLNYTSNVVPLAFIIALSFNYPVNDILSYGKSLKYTSDKYYYTNVLRDFSDHSYEIGTDRISYICSKLWDGTILETTHITSIGDIMYTSYSIWIIITSIILLLAMVGAIIITIKQPSS